jgi:hypothetical protein
MVQLGIGVRRRWLKDLKWRQRHPGKRKPTLDPILAEISRYFCMLCGEKKWHYITRQDKDAPQYTKVGKRWIVVCHACWHLKGLYARHQNAHSAEGLPGCRICRLQLAGRRSRKRSQTLPSQENPFVNSRPREVEPSAADWQPTRVRRSVGLSSRRKRRANV